MSIRDLESASIREFLEDNAHLLGGRVLDFGCGQQPYRDVVETAGGAYHAYDRVANPGSCAQEDIGLDPFGVARKPFGAIVCTQVIQYVTQAELEGDYDGYWQEGNLGWLERLFYLLKRGGYLLMTGPLNWPHVESADLHRFTTNGIHALLGEAGFRKVEVAYRASVRFENEDWPLGWWAKARA